MSDRMRCSCRRCTIRGMSGPANLITIGVLFLLQQTQGGYFSFGHTWPVILLMNGALSLAAALAPTDGHIFNDAPAQTAAPPAPPAGCAPGAYSGQGPQ